MINLQRTGALFKKEFIEIVRDRRSLVIAFLMPLLMILFYGYAVTFDIKNVTVGIVDRDNTSLSRKFISNVLGSGYFLLYPEGFNDLPKNIQALRNEKIKYIITIPGDFTANIKKGRDAKVQVIVDGSIANTAIVSMGYLNVITSNFAQELRAEFVREKGISIRNFPSITPESRVWYNQELRSSNFIIPGLVAIIMMMVAALLTSLTVVREKEYGTYEEIVSTPITPLEFLVGKMSPYVVIGLADVVLVTAFATLWFKVPFKGNILTVFFFSFLFILCAQGIGILISSLAPKQEVAVILTFFATLLPSFLLSGFVFPIESMPAVVQPLTYLVPARYFLTVLRSLFLKEGVTILTLYQEALFLSGVSLLFLSLALRVIKRRKL